MTDTTTNPAAAQSGARPTIGQRILRGAETQSVANGAIVPSPPLLPLAKVSLPQALTGKPAADVTRLLMAGYREIRHIYRAPGGAQIFAVCRFQHGNGDKQFRPLRFLGLNADGICQYELKAVEPQRPLYNLDQIYARPEATVLFVEGEKAADAAAARFPGMVVTTWPNGAAGVGKVDLRDVAGRAVVIWPDNDDAGHTAGDKLAAGLLALGCAVRVVAVPDVYPEKYDLADPDPAAAVGDLGPDALIASAPPGDPAKVAALGRPAAQRAAAPGAYITASNSAAVDRCFDAVRYLGNNGGRDYASYPDWFDLMCAAKHSHGDAGFAPFVELSREYGGTEPDESFRRKWDALEEKSEGARKTMATFVAEARAAGWNDPGSSSEADSLDGGGGGAGAGGRADPASVVLEQAAEAGDVLWADQHGKAHVSMVVKDRDGVERTIHARVGGKRHKGAVSRRYRLAHKHKVLSAEQEKRAMLLFEHDALESGVSYDSANRAAEHDGCVFVDLGRADGKVVRVAPDGWAVVDASPVRFVRGSRGELPLPVEGGTLADFEHHLNLARADVLRAVAFVVGALVPLASFPILLVEGSAGAGKSSLGDALLQLCDPPHSAKAGRLSLPRGDSNLFVHAGGVRVVFIDNMSDISAGEADALCRLATGGGTSARQLYSDEGEAQLNAVRPIIVTCIGTPSGRGDFLSRCCRITALPIQHRRTEEAVMRAFAADRPKMFGFVLTAISAALRNKAQTDAAVEAGGIKLGRMADFCLYAEGAAEVLGLKPGEFSAAMNEEAASMQSEGALGHPMCEALARFFSVDRRARSVLEGHATEVLDQLRGCATDPSALPASNKVRGVLRRLEPGMAELGMTVEVREPQVGTRNRKAFYRIVATEAFQPIGWQLPF